MADMPRILLHQVQQHPFECCRRLTVPARARSSDIGEGMRRDDSVTASGLLAESQQQVGEGLGVVHEPAPIAGVCPRVSDRGAFESPLEPAPLDKSEVLQQLYWRPGRWQPAGSLLVLGQGLDLACHVVAEVV